MNVTVEKEKKKKNRATLTEILASQETTHFEMITFCSNMTKFLTEIVPPLKVWVKQI